MNEKIKNILFIVVVIFLVIFLFLFLLTSCKKEYTPKQLEKLISNNANNYFSKHTDELPQDGSSMKLSLVNLVNKGIIDDLEDMLDKNTTCSGDLTIENNNGYYMYSPSISCISGNNSYSTTNLNDALMENVTASGNGLYLINNEYYFRGDNLNNYLIFDGLLWRITKINSDNSIRIIQSTKNKSVVWDNRYNSEYKKANGYNDLVLNNINSRIKDTLDEYYSSEKLISDKAKGFIKKTNLCIGKRSETDTTKDGSIECSNILSDQYMGLIQLNEYMIASLDENCTTAISTACRNYNYLATMENNYWTLTADSANTYKVFKISTTASSANANSNAMARLVINISENTNVTGTGSKDDPYIVSGLKSEIEK